MDHRSRTIFAFKRRDLSYRSLLLGAAFVAVLIAASFVDLDAMLRYFQVIGHGSPLMTLETGAIISIASAVPFLAMGMSISADSYRAQRERD